MNVWRIAGLSLVIHAVISFSGGGEVQPLAVEAGDRLSVGSLSGCELLVFVDPACPVSRRLLEGYRGSDRRINWLADSRMGADTLQGIASPGVRVDASPNLFAQVGVRAVPAAVLLVGGEVVMAGGISDPMSLGSLMPERCAPDRTHTTAALSTQ